MATTTPNFGWSVPTSTDLVKDGATAIETLGDSIDATLLDLKGGTTGQVLKKNSGTDMDFVWSADSAGMTNPMTTTGDIIYSSSGSTPARLGIGTTGQVLNVTAGVPAWATPSGWSPNYQLLNAGGTTMSGSNTITISGISGINSLFIRIGGDNLVKNATANATFSLRLNSDSGNNYYYTGLVMDSGGSSSYPYGTTVDTKYQIGSFGASANSSYMMASIQIDGTGTAGIKPITLTSYAAGGTATSSQSVSYLGSYNGTSAITSISLVSNGTFSGTGQVFVYGA